MSKKSKLAIALLIAISSLTMMVVLASSLANIYYAPLVFNAASSPTPSPTPTPTIIIAGFNPSTTPENDYVQLKNTTSGTIDMTGWWMKGESESGRYDFPSGFNLGAGSTVNVRSGFGTNTASDLYIGLPYSLWTKADNCAYLRNSSGDLVDKQCVNPAAPTATPAPNSSVYIVGFNPSSVPESDYVIIKSDAPSTVDLTGWWMKAESESGRYDFPTGFLLASGKTVNVRSGVGTDSATDLYVGASYSIWTVSTNCAYLRYKDGTLLDKRCVNE